MELWVFVRGGWNVLEQLGLGHEAQIIHFHLAVSKYDTDFFFCFVLFSPSQWLNMNSTCWRDKGASYVGWACALFTCRGFRFDPGHFMVLWTPLGMSGIALVYHTWSVSTCVLHMKCFLNIKQKSLKMEASTGLKGTCFACSGSWFYPQHLKIPELCLQGYV